MSYSYTRSRRLSIVLSYSYTPPYNVDVRHPAQENAARSIVSTTCPAHRMDEGRQKKKIVEHCWNNAGCEIATPSLALLPTLVSYAIPSIMVSVPSVRRCSNATLDHSPGAACSKPVVVVAKSKSAPSCNLS